MRSKVSEPPPKQIGPYRVLKLLGAGGMGNVYRAVHVKLNRHVALKVLRPELAADARLLQRFMNEARAAAMPAHENLVLFYEYGQDDRYNYLALEYIDGRDVSRLLKKRGPLPVDFCLHVVKQVVRALEHASKHGFVHRDIKPANILITRDKVAKLADLGLARQLEEGQDHQVTRDGYTLGTVDYMSPEQSRDSHSADVRSDIYSLGCTWYHMLTGSVPFPGKSVADRLYNHARAAIPNVRDVVPTVPEDMALVIEKMLAKEPEERYQSPTELLAELEGLDPKRTSTDMSILSLLEDSDEKTDASAGSGKRSKRRGKRSDRTSTLREAATTPGGFDPDEFPEEAFEEPIPSIPVARRRLTVGPGAWVLFFVIGCVVGMVVLAAITGGGGSSIEPPNVPSKEAAP